MNAKFVTLTVLASAFALTPIAKADSVTFETHVGNKYTYDITFDKSTENDFFLSGFTLTGLSGVTDADLSGNLASHFATPLFGEDFVLVGTLTASEDGAKIPFSVGTLTITSLDAPGIVSFAIQDSNGLSTGLVGGPADLSPVPEPSSLVLLGSGLLGVAGAVRRKLSA